MTFSLTVSLIVALTLIPMFASRQFGATEVEEAAPEKMFFLRRWLSTFFYYVSLGVMLVLWALQVTVSVVVLIGVIMLAGIVVNNAIILVATPTASAGVG